MDNRGKVDVYGGIVTIDFGSDAGAVLLVEFVDVVVVLGVVVVLLVVFVAGLAAALLAG